MSVAVPTWRGFAPRPDGIVGYSSRCLLPFAWRLISRCHYSCDGVSVTLTATRLAPYETPEVRLVTVHGDG